MRRCELFIIICVAALTVSCTEGKPPQLQSWKEATGAEAYERSFWKFVEDGDFALAERSLAPIYTLATSDGVAGRDKAVEYFRSLNLKRIDMADVRVDPQGADMVISYVATLESKSSPVPRRYYITTVWQQVKSGWIAICQSEIPAPAQRE